MENQLETNVQDNTEETKTFTQEEVEKMLQQESDRRVSQALARSKEKWEEEFAKKLETEKSEAEKLAKMSEQERFKLELETQRKQFESERSTFLREKLELETVKQLSESGIPTKFSSLLVKDTAENTKEAIEAFKLEWQAELQRGIQEAIADKLKGKTPQSSNAGGRTMTKQEFGLLSSKEKTRMFQENPDMVNQILGN